MIDLHSHILYGLDDGAKNKDMTLNMLLAASREGIEQIVATPHYISGANRYERKELLNSYNKTKRMIIEQNLKITLHFGNEILLDENTPNDISEGKCLTIANTRYVLIELPMWEFKKNTQSLIREIINIGCRPVIAHPERYSYVQEELKDIKDLICKGCIIQINSSSIAGVYGKKAKETSKKMLMSNMAHLVASDAHTPGFWHSYFKESLEIVNGWVGNDKAFNIFNNNPQKVLNDEELEIQETIDINHTRSFFDVFERVFSMK